MEIEEAIIDEIEGKLLHMARNGNIQAIKTVLKAKARNRGYTNKLEISQTSKQENVDTQRLEILLSDSTTAHALEVISSKYIEVDNISNNEK